MHDQLAGEENSRYLPTIYQSASHENSEISLQLYDLFIQGSHIRLKYITLQQAKDKGVEIKGKR